MSDILLKIEGLHASVEDKEILKGVDLTIRKGEIHAVMGPNGAGKSTLSAVLAGKPQFTVTAGSIEFMGQDLLAMSPEERAWAGIFLSFQYPVEIPGVTITNFMKTAVNAHRAGKGLEPMKAGDFLKLMREKMAFVQMKPEFAKREVNVGFSGGEKKRNEIFQMAMLDPTLAILDETDSGLDVDALRGVVIKRFQQIACLPAVQHAVNLLQHVVRHIKVYSVVCCKRSSTVGNLCSNGRCILNAVSIYYISICGHRVRHEYICHRCGGKHNECCQSSYGFVHRL